jgi:hypothetical protein
MENDPLVREGLNELDEDEDSPVLASPGDDDWDEAEPEDDEDAEL